MSMTPPGTGRRVACVLLACFTVVAYADEPLAAVDADTQASSFAVRPVAAGSEASTSPAAAPQAPLIHPQVLRQRLEAKEDLVILDVRSPEEFAEGHLPNALNIPHTAIAERIGELGDARGKEIVVYCRSGVRSEQAIQVLREQGFDKLRHLEGDFIAWDLLGNPVVRPDSGP